MIKPLIKSQVRDIGDKIANLSPEEAKELIRYMTYFYGDGLSGMIVLNPDKTPPGLNSAKLKIEIVEKKDGAIQGLSSQIV